jgi:hypothetical protein
MIRFGKDEANKTGFTKNISLTGVNINTNNVFAPGTTIQMELAFPSRRVDLWGRVMWAKKVPPSLAHVIECGMGVHFLEPPEDWPDFFKEWEEAGK